MLPAVSPSPQGFNEGQRSSINVRLGVGYLCVHPVNDIPFIPDNRARTQLDLLREGPIVHAGIDEGLAHISPLNYPGQEEEAWGPMSIKEVGWSFPHRPT